MRAKYNKGEIVRLKDTGELVRIEFITPAAGGFWYDLKDRPGSYAETELTKINKK